MVRPRTASSFQDRCGQIVERFRGQPDASARTLLVTIFGDCVRPHGGEIWTGSLVRLVEPLGISERLVRTSLNRLAGEGLLATRRAGRRSFYSVTPAADREFASVEDRIYHRAREAWDGRWTIVAETAGLPAPVRTELRQRLGWLGFAALSPGVQICPADRSAAVGALLEDLDACGGVAAFRASALPSSAAGGANGTGLDDRALARRTSDLDVLTPAYEAFLARFGPLVDGAAGTPAPEGNGRDVDAETAFLTRTLLLHNWRRIVLREPALPAELWPDAWVGDTAYDVAGAIYRRLSPGAEAHLRAVCETPAGSLPALDPLHRNRFNRR
ncbi:MAG: PaaX family transcriptional regulator [Acidimicrobiia bacterium]